MADFPALPLWTDAYLADTRHLSTLEHGAYLLLMMEAWRRPHCDLPDDDRILARLAGLNEEQWIECKSTIMEMWNLDGRRKTWTQKRLLKERSYVKGKSKVQRDKALKRWNNSKNDDAAALPDTMPERCPDDAPTPTPTPIDNASALSERARDLMRKIGETSNLSIPDPQIRWDRHREYLDLVTAWLDLGADEALIMDVVGRTRRGRDINHMRFFDDAIREAVQKQREAEDAPLDPLIVSIIERERLKAAGGTK